MTTTLTDVRDRLLADPELLAEYERLPSIRDASPRLRDLLEGVILARCGSKRCAQLERRAWRAKDRAAHPKPLSTKVVHPRVLVDAPPSAKKGKVVK